MNLSDTPHVDPSLGAAGLAFVTAVATTLWNTGGRAALERRAIQQELQIAAGMPNGIARRQLEVATEGRVAMYVFRRVGPGRGAGFHFKMLVVVVVVYGLVGGLGQLIHLGPDWVEFITQVAFLSAVALLGLVAALWVSEAWRDHMADLRRSETSAALKRLRQLDEVDSNPRSKA